MTSKTYRRKSQKKMKRIKYKRCSICGEWSVCTLDKSNVPTKKCINGHIDKRPWTGGGTADAYPSNIGKGINPV